MAHIEARLGHLLRGGDSTSAGGLGGAMAAVPAAAVTHAERRLHQLMSADRNQEERAASPTSAVSVQSWAERGYHGVPKQAMREMEVAENFFVATRRLGIELLRLLCEGMGLRLDYFEGQQASGPARLRHHLLSPLTSSHC
ncbi:hypothetical protein E2562_024376 [Oryza meyeriana var. granulata]|uniref:Uncharacterized protein n=1 Tax=Oryza meyeriana var. granulata TaxID=110450 RepID=A0A6G1C7T0_9ORYZ|nr:hypothetical protein E2562_024376 [Oryza meyeriana var. granulata]